MLSGCDNIKISPPENVVEFPPDVPDHLHHGVLGGLVEVLGHVHVAQGRGEAAAGRAGADPPSRGLLLGAGHILPKMMENKSLKLELNAFI